MLWNEVFQQLENYMDAREHKESLPQKTNDIGIVCNPYIYGDGIYLQVHVDKTLWRETLKIGTFIDKEKYLINSYYETLIKVSKYFNLVEYIPFAKCNSCNKLFVSRDYVTFLEDKIIRPIIDSTCDICQDMIDKVKNDKKITGVVYFYKSGFSDHVKIGYSKNVEERINSFSTAHAGLGKLLFTIPGNYSLEKELHEKFNNYHYSNEWFIIDGRLKDFIAEVSEV